MHLGAKERGRFGGLSLVDGSGRSGRYRFSPPPPLVRADLYGLHPGLSFGARLEHLAVANNDSGLGGRLLVHDGAFLRGGVLHYIKFRLSVGSAGHDCCGCGRNKKLLHGVSSIASVSLRLITEGRGVGSTAGNYVCGFTNFQFLGGEPKRVDMNASRMGSSETVYFELNGLRLHIRTTVRNESPAIKLICVRFSALKGFIVSGRVPDLIERRMVGLASDPYNLGTSPKV